MCVCVTSVCPTCGGYEFAQHLRADLRQSLSRLCRAAPVWRDAAAGGGRAGGAGDSPAVREEVGKSVLCDEALGKCAEGVYKKKKSPFCAGRERLCRRRCRERDL